MRSKSGGVPSFPRRENVLAENSLPSGQPTALDTYQEITWLLKVERHFLPKKVSKFFSRKNLSRKNRSFFGLKNQSCDRRNRSNRKKSQNRLGQFICQRIDTHNQIYSRIWYAFSMLKLTKYPHPYGEGFKFYYTKHFVNRFIPHVYRARPTHGPWQGSKKVRIWPKIQ